MYITSPRPYRMDGHMSNRFSRGQRIEWWVDGWCIQHIYIHVCSSGVVVKGFFHFFSFFFFFISFLSPSSRDCE